MGIGRTTPTQGSENENSLRELGHTLNVKRDLGNFYPKLHYIIAQPPKHSETTTDMDHGDQDNAQTGGRL